MEFTYQTNDQTINVQVQATPTGYAVTVNGRVYAVTAERAAGRPWELALTLDGARHLAWVAADGPRRWVALEGHAPVVLSVPQAETSARRAGAGRANSLEAQMPGVVRRVLVAAGDAVERGQALVMLEAMKMEIRVSAPRAGVVGEVGVVEGQAVVRGQVLVSLVERL